MMTDPTLTKAQIEAEITDIKSKLEAAADIGDEIKSMGASVTHNHRYNHYKRRLEELYSMKANLVTRGEW